MAAAPPTVTHRSYNNNNNIGVACCLGMSRDGNAGAPFPLSLFVPSELSLSHFGEDTPAWGKSPEDDERHSHDMKQYLSQSALTTKSDKILLIPTNEYIGDRCYDWPYVFPLKPSYDGTIGVMSRDGYFILKENKLLLLKNSRGKDSVGTVGRFLIYYHGKKGLLFLDNIGLALGHLFETPRMDSLGCHLSSPFLADIQNKDGNKLLLHRFAITSPFAHPWDCILMAIDKSRGYLVYSFVHEGFHHCQDCWHVLDSMTNYTSGDLLYFHTDRKFYVLPNAKCGDLEVWTFQNYMCSKTYEINAELHNNVNNNNTYHHIHSYLAESLDKSLLLVRRYVTFQEDCNDGSCDNGSFKTGSFEVFELNFKSKQWEIVPSLGDEEALFVGSNSSFSLSPNRYPEVIPNCIYFTDQICHHSGNVLHGKDNGIFHLQDCTFTPLLGDKRLHPDDSPVWLLPQDEQSCLPNAYLH
ncbi:hypothetical protein LIER_33588 [Lithospermum erythrorhizon]|uniref:KIB1-4 beta-propeller domain-containing protein n=1 Tax=Lithospermum erythrorhizon TaxID=34254 RepID=A0AAV3S0D6_LITER